MKFVVRGLAYFSAVTRCPQKHALSENIGLTPSGWSAVNSYFTKHALPEQRSRNNDS